MMTTRKSRRGRISIVLLGAVALLIAAGAAAFAMREEGDARQNRQDVVAVRRGSFEISVPVMGELAPKAQIEIRNQIDEDSIITEIVPEGKHVTKGEVLVRLNDEEIREELREEQDEVNGAVSELITAESELAIVRKDRESELAKADLAVTLADLALKAWLEGDDVAKRQELQLARESAEKNNARLAARFAESGKLLEQKFISLDEYKQDEIAMIGARAKLAQTKLDIEVYEKYTHAQERAQKESDLDQARSERARVEQQFDAEVRTAASEVKSKEYQLQSQREHLADLEQRLKYCTMTAPADGMVVYYTSLQSNNRHFDNDGPPMVGTEVKANQPILVLPDTSQMVAVVKVSEALTGLIAPGQRATLVSDAVPDMTLVGEVESVSVLAVAGGWRDPNRRDYSVRIALRDADTAALKPSMRCKGAIDVARVDDALHIPAAAVHRAAGVTFAYVPRGSGYTQRPITIGRSSESFVEVLEGLSEDEMVLIRAPDESEITGRLPQTRATDAANEASADAAAASDESARPAEAEALPADGKP